MALQPIPPQWCKTVRSALPQARFTNDCHRRWQREFPGLFRYELEEAFRKALSSGCLHGCPVQMTDPPGETWEFYFELNGTKTYGKLLLRTDKKRVVIFSAHRPEKKKLRCE